MNIRYRHASSLNCFAVVCFAAVLLSTTVQAAHFCAFQEPSAQAIAESDSALSGGPACLVCLMAPSASAIILLIAFVVLSRSSAFVGGLQMRFKPILDSFQLYIRPPPLD
jgi:hypothetical protein